MDLDDLNGGFIQILIVVVVVFVGIIKYFYGIFVKPFSPPGPPGLPGSPPVGRSPRQSDIKDFLEELRRDLGHGEAPPPARQKDGLMDEQRPETGYIAAERRAKEEEEAAARLRRVLKDAPPQPASRPVEVILGEPVIPVPWQEFKAPVKEAARKARQEAARAAKTPTRIRKAPPPLEIPEPTPISASGIGSESSAGDLSGDSVLGVDLERAVILQEIFGRAACRRRGFGSRPPKPPSS